MIWENIKEALSNIYTNKMRSVLTMLGIIIGISAVILITTIGSSIQSTLKASLTSLGGNSLYLYLQPEYPDNDADWENWEYPELEESDYITQEMIDELIEAYPDEIIGLSASNYWGNGSVKKSHDEYANVTVMGITPAEYDTYKVDLFAGREITDQDCGGAKNVCVISDRMAKNYFGDENPIGKQVTIDGDGGSCSLVVIGIYEYNPAVFGKEDASIPPKDRNTIVFVPYQTVNKLMHIEEAGYSSVSLVLSNTADSKIVETNVKEAMAKYYEDNETWSVAIGNFQSQLKIINIVINVVTVAISLIAAISLIVGGVGVMNIMLVSITERTKEIGIRKALGAKNNVIRLQFVIEAIVLCLIGGIIGIMIGLAGGVVIGVIASFVIQNFYSDYANVLIVSVRPSLVAIALSVFFSMLTGVFFGFYPANKAAKMEVIDALRYE